MSKPVPFSLAIILIKSFGGLDILDKKQDAYQGFNDATLKLMVG